MIVKPFGSRERGQILPMVALLGVVLIAMVGLAIDVGRLMLVKAQLSRGVDAAALAGSLKLPSLTDAQVEVNRYMAANEPNAWVDTLTSPADRQVHVVAHERVNLTFLRVLTIIPGIHLQDPFTVSADAVSGFGILAVDTYVAIDATGSMGDSPCSANQTESGCPIKEAKAAATTFTDTLLGNTVGSGATKVGVGAFRGCYNPPRSCLYDGFSAGCSSSGKETCVTVSQMVRDLSASKSSVESTISGIWAIGHTSGTAPLQPDSGSGTNVCYAMYRGAWGSSRTSPDFGLFGPNGQTGTNTLKILVILSDGDNTYAGSLVYGSGSPPTDCRPSSGASSSDPYLGSSCMDHSLNGNYYTNQTRERSMDQKTSDLANTLKSQGVEIYVVGFGVCGTNDPNQFPTTSYCSGIGGDDYHGDNVADRRLLKCIASSTTGTNNHYFEAASASQLPDIFGQIARQIGFRLIQ